jgi:3-hexulose-6-phosphate synthase/6-phospho-3-hexuloisomerase
MKMDKKILQVALDFVDLNRAMQMAEEAAAGGADWLEAGTPLIKSAGLDAVRQLKSKFPNLTIVADMKIMDAGRTEVEYAAKAGAGVVTVLAAASDTTIAECVEAARQYGVKIAADLINSPDPVSRAQELVKLGVDYIDVHTPIDMQMQGVFPFDILKRIAEVVDIPICVAGGITSETAADAVNAGGSVIIVGGSITKSKDAVQATKDMRQAIDSGVGIDSSSFRRATAENIREILMQVSSANVSDAMHRGGVAVGIKSLARGMRCCGPAFTVRTSPGDWAKPVEAIDLASPGDVLVIDAGGVPPSPWGELATTTARNRKLAGVLIDGAARDTMEIIEMNFPVFCSSYCPNAGEPKGHGEIGVNLRICHGMVNVAPGDWILADDDGVVVIPAAQAVEITNRAMNVLESENRIREEINRGSTLAQVVDLLKWEKK